MTRFLWLHPEWWMLAMSVGAWAALLSEWLQHDHSGSGNLKHWLLMVLAMMLPLLVGPVRSTAMRSLWRRRHQSIGEFLCGYVALWMMAGVALDLAPIERSTRAATAALLVATLWHLTPFRRRAFYACHRTLPLAPSGWRAHYDCLRYGGLTGWRCLTTCLPLMLACALTGHNRWLMAAATLVGAGERYLPRMPEKLPAAVHLLLAGAVAAAVY